MEKKDKKKLKECQKNYREAKKHALQNANMLQIYILKG